MKKLIYTLTAIATLAFAAGCANELDGPNPVKGEFVETTFTVALDDATATKAAIGNDAAKIDKLLIRAFKSDGTSLKELDGNFEIDEVTTVGGKKQFGVKAKLVRNFPYKIAFFALHNGAPYTMDDNGVITMAAGAANDENLDVFYKVEDITLDPDTPATLVKTITLTRPLAQINVLSDPADWAAAKATGILEGLKSSVTITAPTKLNLVDGTVDTPAELAFTLKESPTGKINVGTAESAVDANYVAMAYILSGTSASPVNVTFHVESANTDFAGFTRTVNNVPNKANFRTNLHGDLFTTTGDFTVVLDPNFGSSDDNQNINIPQPTISQPTSIPAGAALPTVTAGNNVTTSLAAGNLYFGIDSNSDGAITYSSSDHTVGTINTDGVFTPVGAGTTNITVTQAAGKQTKAIGDPLSEITIVYHVTVEATRYDITFSAGDNGAFTEIKLNGDGVTLTENKISAVKNDVITFQVAPVANYEVDVVKVGDEPLTATEEVYSYTVGEAAATITATFKEMGTVATPVLSPGTSYFTTGDKVTMNCETEGASIYYTTDGSAPTASSTLYSEPVTITTGTFKAIAVKTGMLNSAVAEATYTARIATEIVIADQNMTFGDEITLTPVVKAVSVDVTPVTFTYAAGNNKVTVTSAGVVDAVAAGESSVTINATVPDAYLAPAEKTVAITIAKASSSISWKDGDLALTVGGATLDLKDQYTKSGSEGAVSFAITEGEANATLSNGVLTAVAAGTVKVKATLEGDANYDGAETAEKAVTVNAAATPKSDQNLSFDKDELEFAYGESYTLPVLSGANTSVTYSIEEVSPAGAISVNASTGALTVTKAGAGMVYARAAESETYNAGEAYYMVTVNKAAQTLSFGATTTFEIDYGDDFTEPTLSGAQTTVTYSIETVDGNVTINSSTGALTISGADIVTVTATAAADDRYKTASVSYELTINAAVPPTPSNHNITITPGVLKSALATAGISQTNGGYTGTKDGAVLSFGDIDFNVKSITLNSANPESASGSGSSKSAAEQYIQMQKTNGTIANKDDLTLVSITIEAVKVTNTNPNITLTAGTTSDDLDEVNIGTAAITSEAFTAQDGTINHDVYKYSVDLSGYNFFKIGASAAAYIKSITIVYSE